jgi:hypothetical protein
MLTMPASQKYRKRADHRRIRIASSSVVTAMMMLLSIVKKNSRLTIRLGDGVEVPAGGRHRDRDLQGEPHERHQCGRPEPDPRHPFSHGGEPNERSGY